MNTTSSLEQHGDFVISESTAPEHPGEYDVMNLATGHVRWFATVAECRQFIGLEESPGPKWEATPLDEDGKPMAEPAIVTAEDEDSAKEAGRSWFHFIGVFRIKDVRVKQQ